MRSYRIKLSLTGCVVTRNTKHIRKTVIKPWMYKHIEKLKQTDIDNDQDKNYNHYADKVLPDNAAMPTSPQTLESPHVNLAPKLITSAVKGVEPKYEQPFVVKTRSGRVIKPTNHFMYNVWCTLLSTRVLHCACANDLWDMEPQIFTLNHLMRISSNAFPSYVWGQTHFHLCYIWSYTLWLWFSLIIKT